MPTANAARGVTPRVGGIIAAHAGRHGSHHGSTTRTGRLGQPARPRRALGADGRPARSHRAPFYADVPDEQWDDWRWQLSNRVNDLETFARILELTDEERAGLGAPDKFRVDITPYFI